MFAHAHAHAHAHTHAHADPTSVGFDPVAETEKLLHTLPAEARAKSDAFFELGYILQGWNLGLGLAISEALLKFGVPQKLRDIAGRKFKGRFRQGVRFIALFIVVSTIIDLPSGSYVVFIREHRLGLSNLTTGAWLGEQLKGLILGLIFMSLVGSLLYKAVKASPQRRCGRASLATPFFMLFRLVIVPVDNVLEFDASK